jgi:hypothetical protein
MLRLAERTHCTLCLPGHASPERIARNARRRRRIWLAYDEAAAVLSHHGIEFVLLKGFTHEVDSGLDPERRYQSDLDLLCLPADIPRAQAALQHKGYRQHGPVELSAEHPRPLVKPFTWQWRGDYFDPHLPISIELHHTLWDAAQDRIRVPGMRPLWDRRTTLAIEGRAVPCLSEVDRLAAAALHVLRHVLRNDARPAHAFEFSAMLTRRMNDRNFWDTWFRAHDAGSRALQAVAFEFVRRWFGVLLCGAVKQQCRDLSPAVHAWFDRYAFSPLVNLVEPNKDVLRLHLALLPSRRDRFAVTVRRLLPVHRRRSAELGSPLSRLRYHAVALARLVTSGSRRRSAAASAASHTSD